MVFRGHKGNIDCAQILTVDSMISAGTDGLLCLWKETQKKPVAQIKAAHGYDGDETHASTTQNPRWISSLSTLKMSDLLATGSNSGDIKLWKAISNSYCLEEVASIPCNGFVNGIALSTKFIVAGTGNEHRLGRWWRMKGALNKVILHKFSEELTNVISSDDQADSVEFEDEESNQDSNGDSEDDENV